jgi:hypothetical protein
MWKIPIRFNMELPIGFYAVKYLDGLESADVSYYNPGTNSGMGVSNAGNRPQAIGNRQ